MPVSREVVEGPQNQGADEQIAYPVTVTNFGSTPTSVSVKAYDITNGGRTDVMSSVLSGSASIGGDIITTPTVTSLVAGNKYRIEIKFTSGGNVFECYFLINAEN